VAAARWAAKFGPTGRGPYVLAGAKVTLTGLNARQIGSLTWVSRTQGDRVRGEDALLAGVAMAVFAYASGAAGIAVGTLSPLIASVGPLLVPGRSK
jgi:hypothetical protein